MNYGITEPDAGSDTAAMAGTPVSDRNQHVLNGRKMWIAWCPVADMSIIFAISDEKGKHNGMSVFVMDADAPGISIIAAKDKLGLKRANR